MIKKTFIPAIILVLFSISSKAQVNAISFHEEEKKEGTFELITSGIYAHSFKEKKGAVGTEVHFTYWFNPKWGGGLSYTAKFNKEKTLHDIALLGSVNPARWVTVNAGANFGLKNEIREFELGLYAEAEINIRPAKWFHFGPVLGTVLSKNTEATIGVHLGFEF